MHDHCTWWNQSYTTLLLKILKRVHVCREGVHIRRGGRGGRGGGGGRRGSYPQTPENYSWRSPHVNRIISLLSPHLPRMCVTISSSSAISTSASPTTTPSSSSTATTTSIWIEGRWFVKSCVLQFTSNFTLALKYIVNLLHMNESRKVSLTKLVDSSNL